MFFELGFIVSLLIAAIVSFGVAKVFERSISTIYECIVRERLSISSAFTRYVKYAAYLVGVSGGARAYSGALDLWSHYDTISELAPNLDFSRVAWLTTTYVTIIETLRALAYLYSALFLTILIAYVIVTAREKSDT